MLALCCTAHSVRNVVLHEGTHQVEIYLDSNAFEKDLPDFLLAVAFGGSQGNVLENPSGLTVMEFDVLLKPSVLANNDLGTSQFLFHIIWIELHEFYGPVDRDTPISVPNFRVMSLKDLIVNTCLSSIVLAEATGEVPDNPVVRLCHHEFTFFSPCASDKPDTPGAREISCHVDSLSGGHAPAPMMRTLRS